MYYDNNMQLYFLYFITLIISLGYIFLLGFIIPLIRSHNNQLIGLLFIPVIIILSKVFDVFIKKIIDKFHIPKKKNIYMIYYQ